MEFGCGADALNALDKSPPRIILLSNVLGDLSPRQFTRQIRTEAQFKETPMLMVSDRGNHEEVMQALEYGINSYILIPFKPKDLVAKIRKELERLKRKTAKPKHYRANKLNIKRIVTPR